ncbi:MAG: T9SS type A sorting domain-containing protein [Bacteroidota bacterium]
MKRFNFILIIIFIAGLSFAQTKAVMERASETAVTEGSYLIDAHPLLENFEKANHIDLSNLPQGKPSLKKVAWNFTVGSTHTWWSQNTTNNQFYQVPSTCRAVGLHCYVFVEDSSWIKNVNQTAVDQIVNAFDNATPANSSKGVYQMDVDTFGNPPDVDGDSKIIILVLNILDGYNGTGGYTAGYFWSGNEFPTSSVPNSNVAEVYYMDCNPLNLTQQGGISTALQITAHEFQHMIQWNYHGNVNGPNHTNNRNDDFYNEGCSMIAEVVCGYPLRLQSYYSATSQTNVYMTDWNKNPPGEVLSDYARAARFFLYIKEQFGVSALTKFVQSSLTNANAFDYSVFPALGSPRRFSDVVVDWWIANAINNKAVDPKWGYDYSGLGTVSTQIKVNPNLSNYSESVYKFGVRYYKFTSGSNLSINLNTQGNTSISMKAIKIGSTTTVTDLTTNANNSIPDFGTPYPNVILMIYHNDQNEFSSGPFSYTLNSTGTFQNTPQEIAYVKTEPIGTAGGSDKDTTIIYFTGIQGAKLDSIKVALRQAGSLQGFVWKYTGNLRPTPLGAKISGAFTATSNIAVRPTYPYPPVWQNWVKVDLRSLNVDVSNDFAVGFINNGDYISTGGGSNSVMLASSPSGTHSAMYLHKPSSGTANWYNIVDSNGDNTEFLVYAYVSFLTDVKQVVELKPASFKLEQNYPNPFNPSTNISYQLPTSSHVTLKVYDILGKEVATLVDEFQTAGTHNSQFSIMNSQLSSGVYFYRIVAVDPSQGSGQSFIQTKKMILIK